MALESEQVNIVEDHLSILYPPDDDDGWRQLSRLQLQKIRNLATPSQVHEVVFVIPASHWELETLSHKNYREYPKIEKTAGYVCVVQGVKPGKRYKIWSTRHPKRMASDTRLGLMLNNPYDFRRSSEPIRFTHLIRSRHAKSFERFLRKRYADNRIRGDWFELENAHLEEIRNMGRKCS